MSRHTLGPEKAAQRRHYQHRRHRYKRRLSRRYQHYGGRRRCPLPRAATDAHYPGVPVPRHRYRQAGRALRRHRPRHPGTRRGQLLLGGARILRARHRQNLPRRTPGAALRPARHGPGTATRHGVYHRTHDQRRQALYPAQHPRRLDRDDSRRAPLRAVGAHPGSHRRRL